MSPSIQLANQPQDTGEIFDPANENKELLSPEQRDFAHVVGNLLAAKWRAEQSQAADQNADVARLSES